ncbi:hypothetical protein C8R44DRAFT_866111 [Mycena epipterygia]|nr:hypothetical protein C8R44DRAFT_866111 [Mycena epipterygia]
MSSFLTPSLQITLIFGLSIVADSFVTTLEQAQTSEKPQRPHMYPPASTFTPLKPISKSKEDSRSLARPSRPSALAAIPGPFGADAESMARGKGDKSKDAS